MQNYPRHMEEFDGLREGSLSLSCIEVAKIILGCKDPVQFITMEDDTEDEEDEEFDFLLFTKLMDAREAILKMLQNREVDICVRMGMVLNLSKEIQIAVDHGELFQIDELLKISERWILCLKCKNRSGKIQWARMNIAVRCARCSAHFPSWKC